MSRQNKIIHFFKACSRLGTPFIPWRGKKLNIGVEEGPDAILTAEFLANFSSYKVTSYTFPNPEKVLKDNYEKTLASSFKEFKNAILNNLTKDEIQVVLGGDHSITLSSVMALLKRIAPQKIGYIQFDSHADLINYRTTKNFHGMYGRVLVDYFGNKYINSLCKNKLPMENLLYIGNLELDLVDDTEEIDFIRKHGIKTINRQNILNNHRAVINDIKKFIALFDHIHISFDIDVFDASIVKATGTPSLSGLYPEEISPLLEILSKHKDISVDLVEINPRKQGVKETITIGQNILLKLL